MKPSSYTELFAPLSHTVPPEETLRLHASLHYNDFYILLVWLPATKNRPVMSACARICNEDCLEWTVRRGRKEQVSLSRASEADIRRKFHEWAQFYPVTSSNFEAVAVTSRDFSDRQDSSPCPPPPLQQTPWDWLVAQLRRIVREFRRGEDFDFGSEWISLSQERREAELARLKQNQQVAAQQKLQRELKQTAREQRKIAENKSRTDATTPVCAAPPPLPQVPVRFDFTHLEIQETALPLNDLNGFKLLEKASLWWISNQTDSLLCLPYCRVERLEYQIRSALRVLGPLRGRALLSDEVGLGKTIEAGLVLKELLTRGMVKRFLVLTVPSLVDQWEEELNDKFGLSVATTNQNKTRAGLDRFWEDNPAIVASLHTLKQPAQIQVARRVK